MFGNDVALDFSAYYLEWVGETGTDHARDDARHEVVDAQSLSLLVERIVQACKGTLLVACGQSALEKPSKSFVSVDLHRVFEQTAAPSLMTGVLVSGLEDGEGIGGDCAGDACGEGTAEGEDHRIGDSCDLLIELFTMSEHGEVDGAAEAGLEHVGSDAAVEGGYLAVIVEVFAGDGDVAKEVGTESHVSWRNHQDHFDVLQRL